MDENFYAMLTDMGRLPELLVYLQGMGQSPAVQAALLRCICGNPWRPVTLQTYEATPSHVESGVLGTRRVCPAAAGRWVDFPVLAWQGGTVPQMARQIYADRDWGLLPQLADALLDAGCCSREMIDHLQGPGPHCRGCWCLDLLLGYK